MERKLRDIVLGLGLFSAASSWRQSSVEDLKVQCLVVKNVLDVSEKHIMCRIW